VKLTARTIDTIKIPAGKSEHFEFDDEIAGFFLRIRAGGSRTFGYQYKAGQKSRRLSLGPAVKEAFPAIRQRVLDLVAQVRLGGDPAAEKEAARQKDVLTFETVANRYLATKKLKPRSLVETERYLLVVAKTLHGRAVTDIQRIDIAQLLSTAATERGDITANRLRSNLSSLFTWGMKEGLIEANPVVATNKRAEQSRDRVLSMVELAEVWRAVEGMPCVDMVRLLMLTACRRDEIGGLRWSEIDDARITLPKDRVKNGREHIVPLSEPASGILTRRPQIIGWPCVFSRSERGFRNWDQAKKQIDAKLPHLPHWTLHDLRRSCATHMGEIGIEPWIIEAALNHVSGHKGGIAGVYNKARYEAQVRTAMHLWAEHLMAAVTGQSAKVVPLRA
jgi:integrase